MEFFKHPTQVCMTYFGHFRFSMEMAYIFWAGGCKAIVHAFYPDCYIKSTTDTVINVQQRLKIAGCRD